MSSNQNSPQSDSMSLPSSPRLDSTVAVYEAEIARLKSETQQLQQGLITSQQECTIWQQQHRDCKDEVFRLNGLLSRHGREVKHHEDRYTALECQHTNLTKENNKLLDTLSNAKTCTCEAELRAEIAGNNSRLPTGVHGRSATVELESLRSQLIDLQQENSHLKQIHEGSNCQWAIDNAMQQVTDTQQLLEASKLETQSCLHLGEAAEEVQKQNETVQAQLMEATRELRKNEAQVSELSHIVEVYRADAIRAEDRVEELEAELLRWKPQPGDLDKNLDTLFDGLSDSDSSSDAPASPPAPKSTDYSQAHSFDSSAVSANPCPAVTTCIIVNIEPSNVNHWALFKRVQAAISKDTKLDILGPQDLVADFIADMKRIEADHVEQTDAAAHWQTVAHKSLTEVDALRSELRTHPACVVKGHRSLADELEAKELQLQINAQQMAHMQKQLAAALKTP